MKLLKARGRFPATGFLALMFGLSASGWTGALAAIAPGAAAKQTVEAPPAQSVAAGVANFKRLPGHVAVLVTKNAKSMAAYQADLPLAVGTASALSVMAALKQAYAGETLKPATVLGLEDSDRALAPGLMQAWPGGTPVTVGTAAILAAMIGDNTAIDILVRALGRKAIDGHVPARDRPYLTPREFAILKAPGNTALATAWTSASSAGARAHLLAKIDSEPLPAAGSLGPMPREPSVDWFYTSRELCTLIGRVADMPELHINPRLDLPGWKSIAFGGANEPGVVNMTYALEADDGTRYCVTATWNDNKELGVYKFAALVSRLIDGLRH